MLHPVGPLRASVYWRRRAVVAVGAVLALLVIWLLASIGDGGSAGGSRPVASGSAAPSDRAAQSGAAGSSAPAPTGSLTATAPAGDPGPPGDGSGDPGDGSGDPGDGGSTSSTDTQAAVPPACPDQSLRLTVRPSRPAYQVGTLPVLTLSVQNISHRTCTRDLAASQQEVLLYAGKVRLWSSNDCYPGGGRSVQALAPGERNDATVTWSGLSSRPKCAGTRTRVGPGRYSLVGRLGTLRSAPTTLTLR